MTQGDYILGGSVLIEGRFTNAAGDPVDPTNLTLTVGKPDGTLSAVDPGTFTHVSTGYYTAEFLPDAHGRFTYLWAGTGLRPVAADGEFYVREPVTAAFEGWQPPSAAQVWEESRLDFTLLGYANVADLEPKVSEATAWVSWVTGRLMDSTLPDELEPLARGAIRMRVEQLVGRSSADQIQTAGQEGVQSISAGGASITFRNPTPAGAGQGQMVPTSWAALNETLWPLMTPVRLEYWQALSTGQFAPAMAVTEIDWQWPWYGFDSYGARARGVVHEDWGWGTP